MHSDILLRKIGVFLVGPQPNPAPLLNLYRIVYIQSGEFFQGLKAWECILWLESQRMGDMAIEVVGSHNSAPAPTQAEPSGALEACLYKRLAASRSHEFVLNVEFSAAPGITIVFGPSGSGKTTLLECIAGLQQPEREDVDSQQKHSRHINRGDDPAMFPDNVAFLWKGQNKMQK